jgi:multiple sugar transport system substrate-binding protein
MRTTRKLAAVLLAAVLLAACGGGGDDGGGGDANQPVTITVWGMGAEGEKLGTLADEFTRQNPNITVKVTPITWDVAHQKLITSVAGRQTPDVSQLGTTWMAEFAKLGALDEVPDSINAADFFEGAWNTNVIDGKALGVPWYVETRVLYYRTDIAEKAGAKMPPTTWEELQDAATKIKRETGKYGIGMLPNAAGTWQEFMPFVWQNGGDVVDANGNPTLNSPQVVEALEQYTAFYREGLAPKNATQGFAVESGFIAGDYGMFFSGPWHVGILNDAGKKIKGKWAIAPMPRRQTGTSFVGGSNLVVFNASKNKDAAWKFVEFAAKPETQTLWYKTVADLPSNKAAWESGELTGQEELQVFRTQLEDAKSAPNVATWEQLATKINDHIERAALGRTTPAEAAAAMQQDAQTLLQE